MTIANSQISSPPASEIVSSTLKAIWEKQGHGGEPPSLTPQMLWDWMPPTDPEDFFDVGELGLHDLAPVHHTFVGLALSAADRAVHPTQLPVDEIFPYNDWKDKSWALFALCFYQQSYDCLIAEQPDAGMDTDITDLITKSQAHGYACMLRLFVKEFHDAGLTIDGAIEGIHKLWEAMDNKHPGRFKHPFAPIIEAWIADQIPKAKPEHRKTQIAPSFLKESRLVKTETLLPIGQLHTQAPETPMLPGFEPEGSALVPALPLDIYSTGTGSGRGAPIDERIWINALIALPYGKRVPNRSHRTVELETTLRDIRDWLYPNGWTRTRQLPLIIEALHCVHNKRILYQRRRWSLVQVIAMPDLTTNLDDPLPFYVILPDGVPGNGPMIDVETMRLYGTNSAAKFRAWIRLAYLWDDAKKRNGGYPIYATNPEVLRNKQDFLIYPNGDLILSGKPTKHKDSTWHVQDGNQPQTAWYHPWATRTGKQIPNDRTDRIPVLTDSDLIALFYNDSAVNRSTFDNRLREAKDAARSMEKDGNVVIETDAVDPKRGVKGWRIIQARKPTV